MVNRFVSFFFLAPLRNQYLRSEIATKKHKLDKFVYYIHFMELCVVLSFVKINLYFEAKILIKLICMVYQKGTKL